MHVFLLNPPELNGVRWVREARCTHPVQFWHTAWPPYSLALIGGRLRRRGHAVRLLDAAVGQVTMRSLAVVTSRMAPDLALTATSAPTFASDLEAIARLRAAAPCCRIGVLGIHATAEPQRYLEAESPIDFVIRGEPEITADEVVAALETRGGLGPLSGLSLRIGEVIHAGPARPWCEDLTGLGCPDWSLVDTHRYRLPLLGRRYLPVLTSRGCPYSCTFCTQHLYYGRTVRCRSPAAIATEIEALRAQFGIHDFFLWSECFSANREHAHAVCRELSRLRGISWTATTRPDCVDADLLAAMRQAGCWLVGFGYESGSQTILDACRKGLSLAASQRAARWAHAAGLKVLGHFIFGLPEETPQTARATLDLALQLEIDFAQFYCAAPYPGTALHARCQASAVPFVPDRVGQREACMATAGLSAQEVQHWRRRAVCRFYARPRCLSGIARLMIERGISPRATCTAPSAFARLAPTFPAISVTAVIPTLNEQRTIGRIVCECRRHVDDVVVIDGASWDETCREAARAGARVVSLGRRGKGLAIRHAIATEPAEVLVFLDADGSHDPADIPRLLAPLRQGQADLVIASRVTGGSDELYCDPGHVVRALGTWMIQQTVNWWLDAQLTDIQNGFRAIRTSVARQLNLRQSGFCIEQEVAIRCLRAGHRVVNVPSHEARRDHGQSRLNLATTWFEFVSSLAGLLLDRSSDSRRSQPAPGSGRGTP